MQERSSHQHAWQSRVGTALLAASYTLPSLTMFEGNQLDCIHLFSLAASETQAVSVSGLRVSSLCEIR